MHAMWDMVVTSLRDEEKLSNTFWKKNIWDKKICYHTMKWLVMYKYNRQGACHLTKNTILQYRVITWAGQMWRSKYLNENDLKLENQIVKDYWADKKKR